VRVGVEAIELMLFGLDYRGESMNKREDERCEIDSVDDVCGGQRGGGGGVSECVGRLLVQE
jgi:hypothetical protein